LYALGKKISTTRKKKEHAQRGKPQEEGGGFKSVSEVQGKTFFRGE